MAHLSPAFEYSPLSRPLDHASGDPVGDDVCEFFRDTSSPGAATARRTRRLQLRNAGFRGAAVSLRKATPKSLSSSNEWSGRGSKSAGSDVENTPPPGEVCSSGVLQEVGTAMLNNARRTQQPRPGSRRGARSSVDDGDMSISPTTRVSTTARSQHIRTRVKGVARRRSGSGEADRYIEHLENELADVQARLNAMDSTPASTATAAKLRVLEAESKQLGEELAGWEQLFEQRIQDELDKHFATEASLRQQLKASMQEVEELRVRVQDQEIEVSEATDNLRAVEAANIDLEKRVEMMSELLAASKIDLYAGTPGRPRQHERLRSMLPRFPTANSLASSPERQFSTQPSSPRLSFSRGAITPLASPTHGSVFSDTSARFPQSATEAISDNESLFSEAHTAGDSMTSTENTGAVSNLNAWGMPVMPPPKARPTRRMRKFGPGSLGPKPLILPSTNQISYGSPTSAPPLSRMSTSPAFSPRSPDCVTETRRRSSTTADGLTLAGLAVSPFANLSSSEEDEALDETIIIDRPSTAGSVGIGGQALSSDPCPKPNLMEELDAINSDESPYSTDQCDKMPENDSPVQGNNRTYPTEDGVSQSLHDEVNDATADFTTIENALLESRTDGRIDLTHSNPFPYPHLHSSVLHGLPTRGKHILERLRALFGNLWYSPTALARHMMQTAQARLRLPASLLNVQWWLVGVLLGPMAKRRLLARPDCCTPFLPRGRTISPPLMPATPDSPISSPQTPPSGPSGDSRMERSRKNALVNRPQRSCHHCSNKHSPWLWLKFSLTLAFAVGAAFADGPGSLLHQSTCPCRANQTDTYSGRRTITA